MKHVAVTFTALVALGLAAAPTAAKEQMPGQHDLSQSDRTFLKEAELGNLAGVQMGILAASHGSTPTVREFGRWMISTHSFANREMAALSGRPHDDTPSLKPDAKVQDTMGKLQNLQGVDFDRAFLHAMAASHDKDKAVLSTEAKDGEDPQVKTFAANFLPTVDEHFAQVKLLMADADGGDKADAEADANMKAAAGGMDAKPQGNTGQAREVQGQHSGK